MTATKRDTKHQRQDVLDYLEYVRTRPSRRSGGTLGSMSDFEDGLKVGYRNGYRAAMAQVSTWVVGALILGFFLWVVLS